MPAVYTVEMGTANELYAAAYCSFPTYCSYVMPEYRWPRHLQLLASKLRDVESGSLKRLIIALPPRHGKSELTSIMYPSWFLGRNPNKRVMLLSHTAKLAHTVSRRVRNALDEFGPRVFGVSVADDSSSVQSWDVQGHRGGAIATGVLAALSGYGADLMIIDDAVRGIVQATSKEQKQALWEWYCHDARTRLAPNAAIIMINTRWALDDLQGRVLEVGDEPWEVLELPAIAGESDALGRAPGEALWPERFPLSELSKIRSIMGTRGWAALYQQTPIETGGELVQRSWFKRYAELPLHCSRFIQSWDLSFGSVSDGRSYVVGQTWAEHRDGYYLIRERRERLDFVQTLAAIRDEIAQSPHALTDILIESAANGPAVMQTLRREIPSIRAIRPNGSKEARLTAVAPQIEAGKVHMPHAAWADDVIEEIVMFPGAANDDRVDAMTQALAFFARSERRSVEYGELYF